MTYARAQNKHHTKTTAKNHLIVDCSRSSTQTREFYAEAPGDGAHERCLHHLRQTIAKVFEYPRALINQFCVHVSTQTAYSPQSWLANFGALPAMQIGLTSADGSATTIPLAGHEARGEAAMMKWLEQHRKKKSKVGAGAVWLCCFVILFFLFLPTSMA